MRKPVLVSLLILLLLVATGMAEAVRTRGVTVRDGASQQTSETQTMSAPMEMADSR